MLLGTALLARNGLDKLASTAQASSSAEQAGAGRAPHWCLVVAMEGTPMCSVPPASSCPMSAAAIAPSTAPSPSTQPGMITAVTPNTTCARARPPPPSAHRQP